MVRERGERPANPVPPAEEKPRVPGPIDWMKLDEVERSRNLEVLGEWLPELVECYALSEQVVPPCWYLHSEMIVEILALFQYRNQQQFNEDIGPPPSAAIDFQYQLELWRQRMRSRVSDAGCTQNKHMAWSPPMWVDRSFPESAQWRVDFEEHVAEMASTYEDNEGDEG